MITVHGGDLDAIERFYKIPKNEIWDFSGNINPFGFPKKAAKKLAENINIVSAYPDKNYIKLKESISLYTGAELSYIYVGNGSTELISSFIKSVAAENTIILAPAYSEYEREVKILGSNFKYFELKEKDNFEINIDNLINEINSNTGLVIICNPNNPTGSIIKTDDMEKLLLHCKKNNSYVMVDETYIEFADNLTEICSIPLVKKYDNIFVIRGISKFFAAPGLRLGYAICSNKNFSKLLSSKQDPWSVNILAEFAGKNIFNDTEFIEKTKKLISEERKKAIDIISSWKNVKVYNSSSNFILLKLLTDKINSAEIFERLIVKKMLIRDASSFAFLDESFIRFCILKPEQNEQLLCEFKKILE